MCVEVLEGECLFMCVLARERERKRVREREFHVLQSECEIEKWRDGV